MKEENIKQNTIQNTPNDGTKSLSTVATSAQPSRPSSGFSSGRKTRDGMSRGPRTGGMRGGRGSGRDSGRERVKPEFDSKIIDVRRVTRVASGGRRYSFSVAVVAGDHKGRVGVGLGKGSDTALAVEKATREAKKNLIKVPLTPQMTIPHMTSGKYASARITMFPAKGSGVVAGSSARAVIELSGIKDICAKYMSGSKNKLNNAKAAIDALNKLSRIPRVTLRGKSPKTVVEQSKKS